MIIAHTHALFLILPLIKVFSTKYSLIAYKERITKIILQCDIKGI